MARLKSLKPTLSVLKGGLRRADDGMSRDAYRDAAQPWRRWYKTARWQRVRLGVIRRDKYTCQQTGALCIGKHPAPNSPVVDHIVPHRGDEALFWDESNLQTVSKEFHDREKQRIERADLAGGLR